VLHRLPEVQLGDDLVEVARLVDEITLLTYPVVIGQGTRLFPDSGPDTALDLVDSRATPGGVTIQVYRPTGRPQYATATAG
jgi:hypothetical protein